MANIEWLHDYDDGLQRAVNENKPCFWIFSRKAEADVPNWVP